MMMNACACIAVKVTVTLADCARGGGAVCAFFVLGVLCVFRWGKDTFCSNTPLRPPPTSSPPPSPTFLSPFQGISDEVSSLANELAILGDQVDEVKETMDERSNSMTDTSPLVKIKKALQVYLNRL
jgi:hypothetical protein